MCVCVQDITDNFQEELRAAMGRLEQLAEEKRVRRSHLCLL
jgi:hypothetical protein